MLKNINRFLKYVGLNLVHAKKTKRAGYRSHVPIEDAKTDAKCIPSSTCCPDKYDAGMTHYNGDGCVGGHEPGPVTDCAGKTNSTGGGCSGHVDASPTQDNKVSGPTS